MTVATKPHTRQDQLAQLELDLAGWGAERDEKRREHRELTDDTAP